MDYRTIASYVIRSLIIMGLYLGLVIGLSRMVIGE